MCIRDRWKIMFAFPAVFTSLRLVMFILFVRYDTPVSLHRNGHDPEAELVLRKIYKDKFAKDELLAYGILTHVEHHDDHHDDHEIGSADHHSLGQTPVLKSLMTAKTMQVAPDVTIGQIFCTKKYRKALTLGLLTPIFFQFSGIGVVLSYSSQIFKGDPDHPEPKSTRVLLTVIVGVMKFSAALLASTVIEKFGRKKLMFIGNTGVILCYIWFLTAYQTKSYMAASISLIVFTLTFNMSHGCICYLYCAEIMPGKGMGISMFTMWSLAIVVAQVYPILSDGIGVVPTFCIFLASSVICQLYIFYMLETKGKSKEEIAHSLWGGEDAHPHIEHVLHEDEDHHTDHNDHHDHHEGTNLAKKPKSSVQTQIKIGC
eukprot:TRINITY_DN1874_c0_g1_i2.p1 TRINITY_DN1874_c0_g1~~TRINITY_DN1874_c0_g1_i2.p1  ORF type:complete len:391 (-),score=101.10 TRINITY_DN1874_c0_g1_i2:199-1314(-)